MFREHRFRFNLWVLGVILTVATLALIAVLALILRIPIRLWSDPLALIAVLAFIWLFVGILWALFPAYIGAEGLRATDGVGRFHEVRWEEMAHVYRVSGFYWIRHGKPGKALCFPMFLEDSAAFRDLVLRYAPAGNPLRVYLEGK